MRDLTVIIDELKKAASDIQAKTGEQKKAQEAYVLASQKLEAAQQSGADLRAELDQALSTLVPSSVVGRVRTS